MYFSAVAVTSAAALYVTERTTFFGFGQRPWRLSIEGLESSASSHSYGL